MIAAARQILDDKAKENKETIRPYEPRTKGADKEKMEFMEMRRELADLRYQFNQSKGSGGEFHGGPYPQGGRWGGRGGQGGYDRRPILIGGSYRGGMSRDSRPQIQRPPRESGLYMRAVEPGGFRSEQRFWRNLKGRMSDRKGEDGPDI
jgi:hypothetical protein